MSASTENERPQSAAEGLAEQCAAAADPAAQAPDVDGRGRPLDVVPAGVPWTAVVVFLVVAMGLGWLVCLPVWMTGKGMSDPVLFQLCAQALMFTPLLAAIAALIVQRRMHARTPGAVPPASIPRYLGIWPLYPVGRVLGGTGLAVLGTYLLVFATYLVAAAFGWLDLDLTGLSGFRTALTALPGLDTLPIGAAVAIYLLIIVVNTGATAIFAFGEEVGWRGWLITSLRPLGTWPAILIIGVVWGLWHAPVILLGYNFARPDLTGLAIMVGGCVMLGILFGWLRLRTGSVWPAVFAHAALNASAGMLLGLVIDGEAPHPDAALVTTLGVAGWILIALVIVVLVLTGQFRRTGQFHDTR